MKYEDNGKKCQKKAGTFPWDGGGWRGRDGGWDAAADGAAVGVAGDAAPDAGKGLGFGGVEPGHGNHLLPQDMRRGGEPCRVPLQV